MVRRLVLSFPPGLRHDAADGEAVHLGIAARVGQAGRHAMAGLPRAPNPGVASTAARDSLHAFGARE